MANDTVWAAVRAISAVSGSLLCLLALSAGKARNAAPVAPPRPPSAAQTDRDGDGFPDRAELYGQDRSRFADWFAAVAESQYYGMNADWRAEDRDCSGLVRYAFVNALMRHDRAWFAKFRFLPRPSLPPVRNQSYPLPVVSRSVFRVAGGAYAPGDVEAGRLVGRTSAQFLATHSMTRVSRDPAQARRGDVLFFLRPNLRAYHSAVYLGGGLVVYHTGASAAEGGEVRLLPLSALMHHPDRAFHPSAANPSFLGVYRWKVMQ